MSELLDQMRARGGRSALEVLDDGERSVSAALAVSFDRLGRERQTAMRLLGLVPGPDVDTYAAAALLRGSLADARHQLRGLERENLLSQPRPGRFRFHDLLRGYAAGAAEQLAAECRQAALTRLFDYCTDTAATAVGVVYPHLSGELPRLGTASTPAPSLTGEAQATAWLDTELANLLAVAAHGVDHGFPAHTVALSRILGHYLTDVGRYDEAEALHEEAMRAADRCGGHVGGARALIGLGVIWRRGRYAQAADLFERARTLAHRAGDVAGERWALTNLGTVNQRWGRLEPALDCYRRVLALARHGGDPTGDARALSNMANATRRLGRHREAFDTYQRALAVARGAGNRSDEASCLCNLGILYLECGRLAEALDACKRALAGFQAIRNANGEASALLCVGVVLTRLGHHTDALDRLNQGLALHRQARDPFGEAEALNCIGVVHGRLGRFDQALSYQERALTMLRETGNRLAEIEVLNDLGRTLCGLVRPADALVRFSSALRHAEHAGLRYEVARAHRGLWVAHRDAGDVAAADRHRRRAAEVFAELGVPDPEEMAEVVPWMSGARYAG